MSGQTILRRTTASEALPLRSTAPEFTLPGLDGREVSLDDFRGSPVVLAFFPLDCTESGAGRLSSLQSKLPELEAVGAAVLGISTDSVDGHRAFAAQYGITFQLLSDSEPKGAVARRYRVYRAADGIAEPAHYVIDGDGLIRFASVSPRLEHVPDLHDLLACLAEITPMTLARRPSSERTDRRVAALLDERPQAI
jgi:peroxiredoxin